MTRPIPKGDSAKLKRIKELVISMTPEEIDNLIDHMKARFSPEAWAKIEAEANTINMAKTANSVATEKAGA